MVDRALRAVSGERRLLACPSRQLAEALFDFTPLKTVIRRQILPASCRQLQAGSLRSPSSHFAPDLAKRFWLATPWKGDTNSGRSA
jgi:hypothetical protein